MCNSGHKPNRIKKLFVPLRRLLFIFFPNEGPHGLEVEGCDLGTL